MAAADPLVMCPLDEAHQILKSRLQFHLVRCMKNHKKQHKVVCPYNAAHIVDDILLQYHVANCPDYREVQPFIFKTDGKELVGTVTMEQVMKAHEAVADPDEENWDNDPVSTGTYDAFKLSEGKPIVRTLIGAPKAQRRAFRMEERRRMAKFSDEEPMQGAGVNGMKLMEPLRPLRPPRNTSISGGMLKPLRPPRKLETS